MKRTTVCGILLVAAIITTTLAVVGEAPGAGSGVGQPVALAPAAGKRVESLPYFGWSPVRGADHYEFAIAADAGFNAPVLGSGGRFSTRNTRATILKTLPNGTYWWHVRAVTARGSVGSWSTPRKLVKAWKEQPKLVAPSVGGRVSYPMPLVLSWRPVAGAATYEVRIATDAALGSLVGTRPIETSATSLAPAITLHVGTYYWGVTPIDAEGNIGVRSEVRSFQWAWPATPTNLSVRDLVGPTDVSDPAFGPGSDTSLFLPQFRWNPVPGATRYELEINSDQAWAAGSRVCCDEKILAPIFTPTENLRSNRYFWRVRAFDAEGNAGAWAPAGDGTDSFVKTFDNVCGADLPQNCIPSPGPSIHDLRVEDWTGAPVTGGSTSSPILLWDPVPGASSYEYDVTRFQNGACDFTWAGHDHWRGVTATAAWTPLGHGPTSVKPYPDRAPVASDSESLVVSAHYCVRVRARAETDAKGNPVYGDYTTLADAFSFSGPASGVVSALGATDYLTPSAGQSLRQMPFFRWRPVSGAKSYWVIVAKDPSFTNIIDYAFTQVPAYAPRSNADTTTYADETTTYYWVVLPAANANGTGASGDPVGVSHGTFQKQVPPTDLQVALDQPQPVFHWKPVAGAARYELQVSADPNFGSIVEKAKTGSTSYTASLTYPPGKKLYWHVRADDEKGVGLSWAPTSSFQYRLPAPVVSGNARAGDAIPTWRWRPVPGATSYDIHVDLPNGSRRDFSRIGTAAFTATKMTGTGIFHWQVRANFPDSFGSTPGPYSRPIPFARTLKPPTGARAAGGSESLLLLWRPKIGARQYEVEISSKPDFTAIVERQTTDNPTYAPLLSSGLYRAGGTFYWRVAAVDADHNSGDFTRTGTFRVRRTAR